MKLQRYFTKGVKSDTTVFDLFKWKKDLRYPCGSGQHGHGNTCLRCWNRNQRREE